MECIEQRGSNLGLRMQLASLYMEINDPTIEMASKQSCPDQSGDSHSQQAKPHLGPRQREGGALGHPPHRTDWHAAVLFGWCGLRDSSCCSWIAAVLSAEEGEESIHRVRWLVRMIYPVYTWTCLTSSRDPIRSSVWCPISTYQSSIATAMESSMSLGPGGPASLHSRNVP
eukprot:1156404-Pelagomonas_calceolata.AAC.7